jgi:uncharacterized protein
MTTATITSLYRYPVKGLSPEKLARVTLTPGATVPFDRAYAVENGPGRFDPDNPQHLPKVAFLMLMRNERLAALQTRFDDATQTLSITHGGEQVAHGQLTTPAGRQTIEEFFAHHMKDELRGAPRVVAAPGHSFSDVAAQCLHIVNLATVRDLERVIGKPVDPLRFRANVYIDGIAPWAEFGWLNKDIALSAAKLHVFKRTQRCEATNVDPVTAARDMVIPAILSRTFGHTDLGVYGKVVEGAEVREGDAAGI